MRRTPSIRRPFTERFWPREDALLVVLVEEEEHPVADEEDGEDDLLGLAAHELEELLARDEAELDRRLAEADVGRDGLDGRSAPAPW